MNDYKEVYYCAYCPKCEHFCVPETENPCNQCMTEFTNLHSHKPINFKPKEGETNGKRRESKHA